MSGMLSDRRVVLVYHQHIQAATTDALRRNFVALSLERR